MKYCAVCRAEYIDTTVICADCGERLLDERTWKEICEQREQENRETFIRIFTAENQFEADVIKDLLEREGIPVLIQSFTDTSFDGIFIPQKGWASLMVPREHRPKAENIIEAYKKKELTE